MIRPLLLILVFITISIKAIAESVIIPDIYFKAELVANTSINTDGDTEISVAEAEAFTGSINVSKSQISDLTGIEAFINLTFLDCQSNRLTSLDVSKNTMLTYLDCNNTELIELDVTQTPLLRYLSCYGNKLIELDVTQNKVLEYLYCHTNQLLELDLTQNKLLFYFYCNDNNISELDVSQNTKLVRLYCRFNQLSDLDVSQNVVLERLICTDNINLTCIKVNNISQPTSFWQKEEIASYNTVCGTVTSLHSSHEQETLSIYPNPATSIISTEVGTLEILDSMGNLVLGTESTGKVDVSSLETGVYLVSQNGKRTKLIIE